MGGGILDPVPLKVDSVSWMDGFMSYLLLSGAETDGRDYMHDLCNLLGEHAVQDSFLPNFPSCVTFKQCILRIPDSRYSVGCLCLGSLKLFRNKL